MLGVSPFFPLVHLLGIASFPALRTSRLGGSLLLRGDGSVGLHLESIRVSKGVDGVVGAAGSRTEAGNHNNF